MKSLERMLADAIAGPATSPMVQGTVVSVEPDCSITVDIRGGEISGVRYLSHVAPRPGYGIWLQRIGAEPTTLVAVGSMAHHGWPAARVRRSATDGDQNIANGGAIINMGPNPVIEYDPWGMYSDSQRTRLSALIPGIYDVGGDLRFAPSLSGTYRQVAVRANGGIVVANKQVLDTPDNFSASTAWVASATTRIYLDAGGYIELDADQDTGGNLAAAAGFAYSCALSLVYVGPAGE